MTEQTQQQDPRLVEFPVRFSESKLWQIQRNYFTTMGIEAWKEEVPYYISSNAFIGQRYAMIVLNMMRDFLKQNPTNQDPFYILEVGSGMGQFSFYFLKALTKLLETYQLTAHKFCYVISDLITNNIKFCRENISFAPYIQAGVLDFAHFDVVEDTDFYLQIKGRAYSELKAKTPLTIIANYTLDCIKQDAFEFYPGEVKAVHLGLKSRYKNFDIEKSLHLKELKLEYQYVPIDVDHYYQNPHLQALLQDYAREFKDERAMLMMPLGGLQFMDNMKTLTGGNFFVIAGDKGQAFIEKLRLLTPEYRVTYDGCYAFSVNFHAMGEYLKKLGGDYIPVNRGNEFNVNLFWLGMQREQLIETCGFFDTMFASLGPEEYCCIYDEFTTSSYRFSLRSILSFLRLSEWDPDAYGAIHNRLIELLPATDPITESYVFDALEKVKANLYHISMGLDVYNLLGLAYQAQKREEKALTLYEQASELFTDRIEALINAGRIYEKQKISSKALAHYQKAVEIDPVNRVAKTRISALTGKPSVTIIYPILKAILVFSVIGVCFYILTR